MVSVKRITILASYSLSSLTRHAIDAFTQSAYSTDSVIRPLASTASAIASISSSSAVADETTTPRTIRTPQTLLTLRRALQSLPSSRTRRSFFLSSSAFALAAFSTPFSTSAATIASATASAASTQHTSLASSQSSQQETQQYTCESTSSSPSQSQTSMANSPVESSDWNTGYLNAQDAAALDAELMSTPGFSLEQLMELAGLSVAEAVYQVAMEGGDGIDGNKKKHVLLVCGPGNNGGDGLVAARHLVHFGFDATIVYPKPSSKTHFVNLIKQCEDMGIPILNEIHMAENKGDTQNYYDVIVDAIFGFSFRGTAPREPFATAIRQMVQLQQQSSSSTSQSSKTILVSVDVPSGWDVDGGDLTGTNFHPDVLVSLTAPKLSAKHFEQVGGRHFVGGRFLPPSLAEKYGIRMPPYPGVSQVMEMPR